MNSGKPARERERRLSFESKASENDCDSENREEREREDKSEREPRKSQGQKRFERWKHKRKLRRNAPEEYADILGGLGELYQLQHIQIPVLNDVCEEKGRVSKKSVSRWKRRFAPCMDFVVLFALFRFCSLFPFAYWHKKGAKKRIGRKGKSLGRINGKHESDTEEEGKNGRNEGK